EAVELHGTRVARSVRGRGPTQLARVDAALEQALEQLEHHLAGAPTGEELARAVRAAAEPLSRVCAEAGRSAGELLEELGRESAVGPLLDARLRAAQDLTERSVVPTGRALSGDWRLPGAVATSDVPFREVAMAYIETSVTRD